MVSVEEAENIILSQCRDFGVERISLDNSIGRVLAENILADRDMPPFDRVTMDGIAIKYEAFKNGTRLFQISGVQSAGEPAKKIYDEKQCVEIMTGAVLPPGTDTVVPYEDIAIENKTAKIITEDISANQNVHRKGIDKRQNELLVEANQVITPAIVSVAATVGKSEILVKKFPKIVIVSTGDELVDVEQVPGPFQIRRSNDHTILGILKQNSLQGRLMHIPDDRDLIVKTLQECLEQYDVILLTGGVSAGKFDFVPSALEELQVRKLFHKVRQKPGKPFWFGTHARGTMVFAFPGNPVSTFLCFHRYFLPWLKTSQQLRRVNSFAMLNEDFTFKPPLQYFLQVKLSVSESGLLIADPVAGNGSGDLANLPNADAFMEFPLEQNDFKKGEVYPVWVFKQIM